MTSLIRPALNLAHRHFERTKNGILCIGTWLTDEKGGRTQPCLVLLHPGRPVKPGLTIPVVIALDQAWRYAMAEDKSLGDPAHSGAQINYWLKQGLLPGDVMNPRDHIRVLDAINDCLRDLIHMPPKPKLGAYAIGDVLLIDKTTGKTIAEHEVRNDV